MGFIFGLVNLKNDSIKYEDVPTLCDAVKWEGFDDKVEISRSYAFGYCWNINRAPNAGIYISQRLAIVCESRLYNSDKLSGELDFSSPEEAFAKGYLKWGDNFADKFNGDFAVVVIDFLLQKVLLIRDHIGVRPLCYCINEDLLIFSSHEFGIAKSKLTDNAISEEALIRSFYLRKIQKYNLTAFKNIYRVTPGYAFSISSEKETHHKFWYPEKIKKAKDLSLENTVLKLRQHLIKATKDRMTDGIIGTHVSGGIDSSGVAAIVADSIDDKNRLRGYSWSPEKKFDDVQGLNEKAIIEDFANEKEIQISYLSYDDNKLIDDFILPEFEQMPIEIHTMRQACKDGVTSIFSGWGGDEFVSLSFRGSINYIIFRFRLLSLLRWIKYFGIKSTLSRVIGEILPLFVPFGFLSPFPSERRGFGYFKKSFIIRHWRLFLFNRKRSLYGFGDRNGLMLKLLYNYHLPSRMDSWAIFGEKYGIEYKFPLLDKQLLEFWFTVPLKYTCEGKIHRYLYREAMKGILNESIRMRTDKNEAFFQENNRQHKLKIKDKLANTPGLFSEYKQLSFFNSIEFQKLALRKDEDRRIFNRGLQDIRLFLRYGRLVEKYLK